MLTTINLLPWRERQRQQDKKQFLLMLSSNVVGVCLLTLLVNCSVVILNAKQSVRNRLLQYELAQLAELVNEVNTVTMLKTNLISKLRLVNNSLSSWVLMVHLLDELGQLACSDVGLTQLKTDTKKVSLWGHANSNVHIAHFMKKIETNQWLHKPTLIEIQKIKTNQARNAYEFRLNFILGSGVS